MAKKKTEIVPVSPELQKNLDIILSIKKEIDKTGNNCLQIKVVDETTLSVAQQNLSSANQLAKSIEDKRKKIKEPYLEAGKLIDKTCADLVSELDKGISHVKNEIKLWDDKVKEEAKKAQLELEKRLDEEREARKADDARRAEIRHFIDTKMLPFLIQMFEKADSAFACDQAIEYIEKNFPAEGRFEEFWDEANGYKNNYITLLKSKKAQLMSAGSLSEAEKQLIKEKNELALQKAEMARKEAELKAKEEEVKRDAERKAEEERAEQERLKLEQQAELNKTRGVRLLWRFELVDKSKLSEDWITVDEDKVKEYMKGNKDSLKDGEVVNGVKFYTEKSITA